MNELEKLVVDPSKTRELLEGQDNVRVNHPAPLAMVTAL
jgi:hypothetical protein